MGLLRSIASAIYREYDRRIKRASLITEYGQAHHGHHTPDDHAEDDEAAEIVNVPRGTQVRMPTPGGPPPPQR